jgi:two-component system cell cycle response regulator
LPTVQSFESIPPPSDVPRRILIVDDDFAQRLLFEKLLLLEGYGVDVASDADEAIDRINESPPDLILLDVHLEGMSGIELCGELRLIDELRLTPIVLVSAIYQTEEWAVRGLLAGADDFIQMPERLDELKARIRVQLRNRRDREMLEWLETQRNKLRVAALRDPLTGLTNRRGGDKALRDSLSSGEPVVLLLLDIDHFKLVNDTHGHAAGDIVLLQVATTLERRSRRGDVVVRHGGEEFFVLITGVDPQLAATIGERYRAAIEGLVLSGSAGVGGVTVSIGVAVWTAAEEGAPTPERMLAVADAGLYEAKRNGRNRVVTTEAVSDASVLGRIVHPSIIPSPKSRGGVP